MRKLGGPEVKGTDIIETKTQNVNILHPKGYSGQNDTTPRFHSFTIIYHCLVQESLNNENAFSEFRDYE
jgi:hypothetical protein